MEQQDEQRAADDPSALMQASPRVTETPVPRVLLGPPASLLEPDDIDVGWTTSDGCW